MIKARTAKAKGAKLEKWLVDEFAAIGVKSRRQPGSGAFEAFPHDVEAILPNGIKMLCECKQRKGDAWKTGERWIGSADVLVVRSDPPKNEFAAKMREPRVFMKWSVFARLVTNQQKE